MGTIQIDVPEYLIGEVLEILRNKYGDDCVNVVNNDLHVEVIDKGRREFRPVIKKAPR